MLDVLPRHGCSCAPKRSSSSSVRRTRTFHPPLGRSGASPPVLTNLVQRHQFTSKGRLSCAFPCEEESEQSALSGSVRILKSGFADEIRRAVFEKFIQGDSRQPAVTGTGLGLSISKQLVEMMEEGRVESPPKLSAENGLSYWSEGGARVRLLFTVRWKTAF